MARLPFKISNLPAGPRKARRNMLKFYGTLEGDRIWRQKAEEQGEGNTLRQKVIDAYRDKKRGRGKK